MNVYHSVLSLPDTVKIRFSLFSLGKYKEAIELGYKKCLELDPGNTGAKDAMLLSQEKLEEQERAKEKKQTTPAPSAGTGLPAAVPPGFEQLLSSPDIQESMQNLAQQFPGLAGAGNQGGGGQPSLGDLLNNPALMNMAQQVMSSPAFGQMLQNPAFMNMYIPFLPPFPPIPNVTPILSGRKA